MKPLSLNEALKCAGLPAKAEPLNEGVMDRLRSVANNVASMQQIFEKDGALSRTLKAANADMSYVTDINKLLGDLEDAVGELQRSIPEHDGGVGVAN